MPLIATRGASSVQGFGQFAQATAVNYIEDVFNTSLWTGNDTTQTITNGIDLSTKGGLAWIKSRAAYGHILSDTNRGTGKFLSSNTTDAQGTDAQDVTAFNTTGFTIGNNARINNPSFNYVGWTFRKQPKFFDVVTFTGTGSVQTIAHSLGSVPGCIMVKKTSGTGAWYIYHRGLVPTSATAGTTAPENYVTLNGAGSVQTLSTIWNNTDPTSTVFTVGSSAEVNASGASFVAYIFAHNAGGFGLTGTDNVITCGNYRGLGSPTGPVINLGFEPQWLLVKGVKDISGDENWYIVDNMRGWDVDGNKKDLSPNTSTAETDSGSIKLTSTGFQPNGNEFNENLVGYIYIAIRRGPMKVPTTGTSVFSPIASSASAGTQLTTNFPVDLQMYGILNGDAANITTNDRLRGVSTTTTAGGNFIVTSSNAAETGGSYTRNFGSTGFVMPVAIGDTPGVFWNFRRAPSFFDVVCYTGTGSARTVTHSLGVVPELIIVKSRTQAVSWIVWSKSGTQRNDNFIALNGAGTYGSESDLNWGTPAGGTPNMTSTIFSVGDYIGTNGSGQNLVAYLFATCAGVSKVGSYTGTATTLQIDCGFTAGARFVLIKRTNSTGAWYVWDTARGIISGNDPYLLLNSTAAEVTNTDYIDTYSAGFEISSTAPAAINANGGTYIFLAIA